MTTFWAILKVLPQIIELIRFFAGMVRDAEQRGLGRSEAIAEALTIAHRQLAEADAAEVEAEEDHAAHPDSDAGFDQSFRRET